MVQYSSGMAIMLTAAFASRFGGVNAAFGVAKQSTISSFSSSRAAISTGVRSSSTTLAASDDDFDGFSSKVTFLFPGQGAQFVGMCASLPPSATSLFERASSILGYDLLNRCTEGPKDLLDSTESSQPAIFVASMAAVEKLREEEGEEAAMAATVAAGLSLGEYSALCYAGAIDFEDGVRVTKARGEAMQAAADAVESGMVSVIGLKSEAVAEICAAAAERSGEKIQIANYLCNGNYAVSGGSKACDVLAEIAKPEFKARMTVKLAVAGAFHTEFMQPAVSALEEVLDTITISKPRIPVISNVDAKAHSDPEVIKKLLATQVTSPVLWENTMAAILGEGMGFERAVELGPGKVCAGILKRTDKTAESTNVEV